MQKTMIKEGTVIRDEISGQHFTDMESYVRYHNKKNKNQLSKFRQVEIDSIPTRDGIVKRIWRMINGRAKN
jgi:hypothetical protein